MRCEKLKRTLVVVLSAFLALGSAMPFVSQRAAAAENNLITSFEEADSVEALKDKKIISYSKEITLNTDSTMAADGKNSLLYKGWKSSGTDYDSHILIKFDERIKQAYGITFRIFNSDTSKAADLRCFPTGGGNDDYQYLITSNPNSGWQTVTLNFENAGKRTNDDFWGGTQEGTVIPYDRIEGFTGLRIRIPYMHSDHTGVYFDDFRYIFADESGETATVEHTFASFGSDDTEDGTILPDGVSFINDENSYKGTAGFEQEKGGNGFYKISLDKPISGNPDTEGIAGKKAYVAMSVAVPKKYARYLDSVNVNIISNKPNILESKSNKIYCLAGITDGTTYGRTKNGAAEVKNGENSVSVKTEDMLRLTKTEFLSNAEGSKKWTRRHTEEMTHILVYIALPDCNGDEGYSLKIGNITATLKGDKKAIEKIDEIDTVLADFDDSDDLDTLLSAGGFKKDDGMGKFSLSKDAQSGGNALLYTSKTDKTNYNTSLTVNLEGRTSGCVGVEFYVKNLDETTAADLRCFLFPNDKNGKIYSYMASIEPSKGEYKRIRIFFDDVGKYGSDDFNGGSSSGEKMTKKEIKALKGLRIRLPFVKSAHSGILFDSFSLIVKDDRGDYVRRIIDFDNCETGGLLPENAKLTGTYKGTTSVVQRDDGSKALRINYDAAAEYSAENQIRGRKYIELQVSVPKTTFAGATEIRVGMTNNAISCDKTWSNAKNIYQVVSISGGGYYGKIDENAGKIPDTGKNGMLILPIDGMRVAASLSSMTGWLGTKKHWTDKQLGNVNAVTVYITAPNCIGDEGWSVDIDYIDVYYGNIPQNLETETRYAVKASRISPENNPYIGAESLKLERNDPSYAMFTETIRLNINSAAAPQPLKLINAYGNYYSDLKQFTESATLCFYINADRALAIKLTLNDSAGRTLQYTVDTEPSKDGKSYSAYQIPFSEIYGKYTKDNPNGKFDISNIRSVSVLPVALSDGLPESFMLSGLAIWTKEVGSAVVYSGYHYEDNGVSVDAYNDYLPMDTVTVIGSENAESAVANWGIKFPDGLTPLAFKTITLYSAAGDITEPTGRIWIGFKVDSNLDFSEISLYRVFFDGSYIKQRYAVEDGYIMLNTFQIGSFVIVKGKTAEESEDNKPTDNNENAVPKNNEYEEYEDYGDEDYKYEDENTDSTPRKKKIRRRIVQQIVRKKKNDDGLPVWATVLVIAGGAVVAAGGAVTVLLIIKKRRGGKIK